MPNALVRVPRNSPELVTASPPAVP